jgi:exopolysaccharide biosynthesis polyprenyl glycosylphosphotransferase
LWGSAGLDVSEFGIAVGSTGGRAASAVVDAELIDLRYGRDARLRRVLAGADLLTVAATAMVLLATGSTHHTVLLLVLSAPAWIVSAKLAGLYDRDQRTLRHLTVDEIPALVVWALGSVAFITLVTLPVASLAIDGDDRAVIWASAIVIGFVFRAGARMLWRRLTPPERLYIVGHGPLAEAVVRKLELFRDIHAEIAEQLENVGALRERLDDLDEIDRIVVASSDLDEELLGELLPVCRLHGVKLTVVPPTRGMFGTATHLGHVADLPLLDYNTWDASGFTVALKRIGDVVLSAVALFVLSPLFVIAAIAIFVTDGAPVLFRQPRAGEGGQPFTMLKFRTMVKNAEALLPDLVPFDKLDDPMFKLKADPRVTRVGRLLRRTSLDELPQLVNVLVGDMSIVGPRPEQLDIVELYAPEHRFRLDVKPGITGPMQVYGRGELTFDERLAVEREYVENLSFARDVKIVLMTLPAVLGRRGAF